MPARALAMRLVDEGIRGRWRHLFPDGAAPVVVPVPIRPLKYLLRGFNLPSLVAVELARATGWRCEAAMLERASERSVQAALATGARQRNVEHAFGCPGRHRMPEEVLLLDDVYTSGATAGACVAALKRTGAQHIVVVTVARAVLHTRHPPETP